MVVCVCVCMCVCVCFSFVFRGLTDNNETAWESVKTFILVELLTSLAVGN